jgi:hypothetical protein
MYAPRRDNEADTNLDTEEVLRIKGIVPPSLSLSCSPQRRHSLIILAGSEHSNSAGATGVRLKEGANIVPYRDFVCSPLPRASVSVRWLLAVALAFAGPNVAAERRRDAQHAPLCGTK